MAQGQVLLDVTSKSGTGAPMLVTMSLWQDGIVRVTMDERGGQRKRHRVADDNVLIQDDKQAAQYDSKQLGNALELTFGTN